MASKTQKTEKVRSRKAQKAGGKRKAALRTNGSTKSPAVLFGDEQPVK